MGCFKLLLYLCLFVYTGSAQMASVTSQQSVIFDNNIDQHAPSEKLMSSVRQNHKPMFTQCGTYNPKVAEAQVRGTFVMQVHADDPDPDDTKNGEVTYNIEELKGARPYFVINSTTGQLYTNVEFDRDEPSNVKDVYVTVSATDKGQPPLTDICGFKVTITDINDNSPSFDAQEYHSKVSEDLPIGSEVVRVTAYDFDDGDNSRLTYGFQTFPGSTPDFNDYFRIDATTGVVYLQKNLAQKLNTKFKSTVAVHDNGIPQKETTVEITITVVDSGKKPPRISSDHREIVVKENESSIEKVLVNLEAESNIVDKSVVFELVTGKTDQTNKAHTFRLNPTGDNTATITLAHRLDYETVTEYQLTVRAQNKDSLYASYTIIVKVEDVNDEIPTFIELLKGSVVENDVVGAQAMTVRAIDKDGTYPFNKVSYELVTHKELFAIDPNTGVITAKTAFDREEEELYYVTVQAKDGAPSAGLSNGKPNSANQTFPISIEDQNDNPPKFENGTYFVFDILETVNTQFVVIEVKANDNDTASSIVYSIIEGNTDDAFVIEETTGRIKVNKPLDFEKQESYNLTVRAFDQIYNDTAKVIIHIQNVNDEIPVFDEYDKNIRVKEEETYTSGCIINLNSRDPDIRDKNADQRIVYSVRDTDKSFLAVTETGCVSLIKPLDRDPPNGAPYYQGYIQASDNNGVPPSLSAFAELNITLDDINDNAPILNMTEVVWYENQDPGQIVVLVAIDYDTEENGPPFTFEIDNSASSDIQGKFSVNGRALFALQRFDREEKKFYDIPIRITDSGVPKMSGISTLRVIIGDVNDNAAQDGSSEIFVYKYQGLDQDIEIGRVYVEDPDDWDLNDKVFQPADFLDSNFELRTGGMIVMKKDAEVKEYKLNFVVTEENLPDIPRHTVNADVTVTVKDIPEEAVIKSGSIRLNGSTVEEFIEKNHQGLSKKDLLQNSISRILNTSLDNVDVFTVIPGKDSTIDVRFSAHGSPYYAPEKLNNKAAEQQENLERELGVKIIMVSINECLEKTICPVNSSCTNELQIKNDPAVVFTNKTSFVGVKALTVPVCECKHRTVTTCLNGGTPIENGICNCPEGFDGPNCENLGVSFTGNGWAMYPSFDSCAVTMITLNVQPQTDDGLIFYAGPLTARQARDVSHDFISMELREGYIVFKIDVGYGPEEVISQYKKISDGAMHKIRIVYNYTTTVGQIQGSSTVLIEVDECPSECLTWKSLNKSGLLRVNGPLQVGGRSNIFSAEDSKRVWGNPPTSNGFRGCITNFTYNSYVYNLGAPSDDSNALPSCGYGVSQAVTFGIDSNFLVAILVCIAILLILLLAVVVHKRKQDNLNEKEMDDTRENIINYEDEGGGECDTQFDLSVFPHQFDEKPPMKDGIYKQGTEVPADIGSFLDDKKRACDRDMLPCDDVRHYGYEGDGNSSGSLSSLASCTDEGDLKFNYLSSFGPRFRKLADMYGDDASEEESQNGGEESWC